MVHIPSTAQHTASAVMNVSVEVVDGSSIEMNQNDMITFSEDTATKIIFATFSISHDQENTVLTSAVESVQMINGVDSVMMKSTLTENQDENGRITLEFSTDYKNLFTDGYYSGKQIAEIIYL